jgi:hypothetical protein
MQRNKFSHFGTCEVEGDNNKAVGGMEDSYWALPQEGPQSIPPPPPLLSQCPHDSKLMNVRKHGWHYSKNKKKGDGKDVKQSNEESYNPMTLITSLMWAKRKGIVWPSIHQWPSTRNPLWLSCGWTTTELPRWKVTYLVKPPKFTPQYR